MVATIFGQDGLIVLIILLVVVFGGSQLPKLARNLGMAGKEFRKAHDEAEQQGKSTAEPPSPPPAVSAGPAGPVPTAADAPPSASTGQQEDKVTLSKAELDALLEEREARTKRQANS